MMHDGDLVKFRVFCQVVVESSIQGIEDDEVGKELFTVEFPARSIGDLLPEQICVNNISESQENLGALAKQCALSATWKAASIMNDRVVAHNIEKEQGE